MDAVKSDGGGFYELVVAETGDKQRYLSDIFESVAVRVGNCSRGGGPHPKKCDCVNWRPA